MKPENKVRQLGLLGKWNEAAIRKLYAAAVLDGRFKVISGPTHFGRWFDERMNLIVQEHQDNQDHQDQHSQSGGKQVGSLPKKRG